MSALCKEHDELVEGCPRCNAYVQVVAGVLTTIKSGLTEECQESINRDDIDQWLFKNCIHPMNTPQWATTPAKWLIDNSVAMNQEMKERKFLVITGEAYKDVEGYVKTDGSGILGTEE